MSDKVTSIASEIVKVIDIQTKKLGTNEKAIILTQFKILSAALPLQIDKMSMLLRLESLVHRVGTFDKAFLQNVASIIGLVSKVGGLTKFVDIAEKIKLLTRRLIQVSLCLAKVNDFSVIDMVNSAIYTRV